LAAVVVPEITKCPVVIADTYGTGADRSAAVKLPAVSRQASGAAGSVAEKAMVQPDPAPPPTVTRPTRLVLPVPKAGLVPQLASVGVPVPSVAKFCTVVSEIPAETVLLMMSRISAPVGAVIVWIPGVGCCAATYCAPTLTARKQRNAARQMIGLRMFRIFIRRSAALLVKSVRAGPVDLPLD
jgi:hypothetical protein